MGTQLYKKDDEFSLDMIHRTIDSVVMALAEVHDVLENSFLLIFKNSCVAIFIKFRFPILTFTPRPQ